MANPQGTGHQHRLVCGCNILSGGYEPLEIKWCPKHLAVDALLQELGGIADCLKDGNKIIIEPGSVKAARIIEAVANAEKPAPLAKAVRS